MLWGSPRLYRVVVSYPNIMIPTPQKKGVYWRSVDTSGKIKDADYTASLMIEDIYDYGCTKVVLVVVRCNSCLLYTSPSPRDGW